VLWVFDGSPLLPVVVGLTVPDGEAGSAGNGSSGGSGSGVNGRGGGGGSGFFSAGGNSEDASGGGAFPGLAGGFGDASGGFGGGGGGIDQPNGGAELSVSGFTLPRLGPGNHFNQRAGCRNGHRPVGERHSRRSFRRRSARHLRAVGLVLILTVEAHHQPHVGRTRIAEVRGWPGRHSCTPTSVHVLLSRTSSFAASKTHRDPA
jgi:hypothetical protein